MVAQEIEVAVVLPHLLQHRAFARRHLADDGGEDRVLAVGDGGGFEHRVIDALAHIAGELAERRFRLEIFSGDAAFDHQLGMRGHMQVDGLAFDQFERLADQRAGDGIFLDAIGRARAGEMRQHRRAADHERGLDIFVAALAHHGPNASRRVCAGR